MALVFGAAQAEDQDRPLLSERFERDGLSIDFSVEAIDLSANVTAKRAERNALAALRISAAGSGEALSGMRPKAWISARLSEQVATEISCKDKVRTFASGKLAARAEVDLNGYQILTLNDDKSITIINPQVAFNTTRLESVIPLPDKGADWVLSKDANTLFVTLPASDGVAVVDMTARRVAKVLSMGAGSRPTRIALQSDGRYAWVALDGSGEIAKIDTDLRESVATINVGAGLHNIAITSDARWVMVTASESNTVSIIDATNKTRVQEVAVAPTPVAIAYSSAADLAYVGSINGHEITAIRPRTGAVVARIPVDKGVVDVAVEPQGRFVLALNQLISTVTVIDSATNEITASAKVVSEPDQIAFTERYAYVRGIETEKFSLFDLKELRAGRIAPLDIQAGRLPPSAAPKLLGVAPMIVPAPEGNAVLIANAPDQTIYYYAEGMMAPMGTFSNYKRAPLGILILNRSFAETAPGTYSTQFRLPKSGHYDVAVLIDQPRIVHCFELTVPADAGAASADKTPASIIVQPLFMDEAIVTGKKQTLKIRLADASSRVPIKALKDVQLLIFEPPGAWQRRLTMKALDDGIYEASQTFPHAGTYNLLVSAPSRALGFSSQSQIQIVVLEANTRRVPENAAAKAVVPP